MKNALALALSLALLPLPAVGTARYFDAAGFAGRAVGLKAE